MESKLSAKNLKKIVSRCLVNTLLLSVLGWNSLIMSQLRVRLCFSVSTLSKTWPLVA
jgi:hypothetical protein